MFEQQEQLLPRKVTKDVAIMRIAVSLILLIAGFLVLTSPNFLFKNELSGELQKVASGWIGLVAGYWLS